jgi:DNA-binding NarL/FixJ family response regulator
MGARRIPRSGEPLGYVRFPLPDTDAAVAIISAVPANVLLVDDDPGFRSLAVRLLERTGLRVIGEADTVKRAREVVHEVRPAFVLLDVSLPDGDGVALAGELTELPWRPRVVLISSDRDAASAAGLDQSGAAAFIPKDDLTDTTLRIAFAVP